MADWKRNACFPHHFTLTSARIALSALEIWTFGWKDTKAIISITVLFHSQKWNHDSHCLNWPWWLSFDITDGGIMFAHPGVGWGSSATRLEPQAHTRSVGVCKWGRRCPQSQHLLGSTCSETFPHWSPDEHKWKWFSPFFIFIFLHNLQHKGRRPWRIFVSWASRRSGSSFQLWMWE